MQRLRTYGRKAWEVWGHIDSFLGLVDITARIVLIVTIGGGIVAVAGSALALMAGLVSAAWFLLVTVGGVLLATVPNFFMWRALRNRPSRQGVPISQGEQLVLAEPRDGDIVGPSFNVRGYARTFEGNVVVEYFDHDAEIWRLLGVTTARMSESLYPFSVTVGLPPGRHRLRVGDGSAGGCWEGVEIEVYALDQDPEDRIRPRILGVGMNKFHVSGLAREGSYDSIQSDVVDFVREIYRYERDGQRAPADALVEGQSGLGSPMYAVRDMAEQLGLAHLNLDPDARHEAWYLSLTDKGRMLIDAVDGFNKGEA